MEMLRREPHPVQELALAKRNYARICGPRGFCGPFINEGYYDSFPDEIWHGIGDCVWCANSCSVAAEVEKRELRERSRAGEWPFPVVEPGGMLPALRLEQAPVREVDELFDRAD
jgi:hypothetical protein